MTKLMWTFAFVSMIATGATVGVVASNGCGPTSKAVAVDVAKTCGESGLAAAIEKLIPTVLSILVSGGANWQAQLDGLVQPEIGVGIDTVVCTVSRVVSDIEAGVPKGAALDAKKARAVQRGRIYLGLHGAK